MDFEKYEQEAIKTLMYPGSGTLTGLTYVTLGLNGEAGEVAEKVKKLLRDSGLSMDTPISELPEDFREHILKEMGDALWYLGAGAHEMGTSLAEIAQKNIDKLSSRLNRGVIQGSGDCR